MQGFIKDEESGALLRVPTEEELKYEKLKKAVWCIYAALPDNIRMQIPPEVMNNV